MKNAHACQKDKEIFPKFQPPFSLFQQIILRPVWERLIADFVPI